MQCVFLFLTDTSEGSNPYEVNRSISLEHQFDIPRSNWSGVQDQKGSKLMAWEAHTLHVPYSGLYQGTWHCRARCWSG